jgi:hypothetical protein
MYDSAFIEAPGSRVSKLEVVTGSVRLDRFVRDYRCSAAREDAMAGNWRAFERHIPSMDVSDAKLCARGSHVKGKAFTESPETIGGIPMTGPVLAAGEGRAA